MFNRSQFNAAPFNRGVVAVLVVGLLGTLTNLTSKAQQTDLSTNKKQTVLGTK